MTAAMAHILQNHLLGPEAAKGRLNLAFHKGNVSMM
jgi:hypothetical protein